MEETKKTAEKKPVSKDVAKEKAPAGVFNNVVAAINKALARK